MAKGGSGPPPPDPRVTAAAQTSTNLATAQANAALQNIGQVTPYGNLSYSQSGEQFISDPNGQSYWRGPDGQIQSSAPPGSTPTVTRKLVGRTTDERTGQTVPKYRDVETPGTATGWSEIKGYNVPQYTATTSLSPHGQQLQGINNQTELNLANIGREQSGRIGSLLGTPFSFDGAPKGGDPNSLAPVNLATSYEDKTIGATRDSYTNALMARLAPGLSQRRAAEETALANQGIGRGSRAYASSQDDISRGETDARLAAILSGGDEMARMEGLARDRAQFGNQSALQTYGMRQSQFNANEAVRQRSLEEQMALRNQPINEITALMSGSQVQQPQFTGGQIGGIPTTDLAGLIDSNYQVKAQQDAAKKAAQSQAAGTATSAAATIAAAALLASDRKVKDDVEKVGTVKGMPVYSFRYKGSPQTQIGFIAQDVMKKKPGAVHKMGGILHVDYKKALS